eukprot:60934_1
MDIEGYSRLRTISQITFESLPQIVLQIRILFSNDKEELGVTENELMLSLLFAFLHAFIEVLVIRYEAQCCKMDYLYYCLLCLNARSSFIPFVHLFITNNIKQKDKLDFDLNTKACSKIQFKMKYQFSNDTFVKFLTSLSYLMDVDSSEKQHLNNAEILLHGFNVKEINIKSLCDAMIRSENKVANVVLQNIDFKSALNLTKKKEKIKDISHITDSYHDSLLYQFTKYGQRDAVAVLLNNDADIHMKTPNPDVTIIQLAMRQKYYEIFYLLLQRALNQVYQLQAGENQKIFTEYWKWSNYSKYHQHNVFERVIGYGNYSIGLIHSLCLNRIPLRTARLIERILDLMISMESKDDDGKKEIEEECRLLIHCIGWNYDYAKQIELLETKKRRSYHIEQQLIDEIRKKQTMILNEVFITFDQQEALKAHYAELDKFLVFREYLLYHTHYNLAPVINLSLYDMDMTAFIDTLNVFKYGKYYVTECVGQQDIEKMDDIIKKLGINYGLEKYVLATLHLRKIVRVKLDRYDKPINLLSRDAHRLGRGRVEYPKELSFTLPENILCLSRLHLTAFARDQDMWGSGNGQIGVHVFRNNVLIRDYAMINIDHNKHRGYYEWTGNITIYNDDNGELDPNCIFGGDVLKVYCFSHAGDDWDLYCKWIDFSFEYILCDIANQKNHIEEIKIELNLSK